MRRLFLLLLGASLSWTVVAGCGQSSESYSSDLSQELPKPREGSPDFEPIKPQKTPDGGRAGTR